MTEKRLSLWSGPRNVSTALMYSFAQRPDTRVVDEPFYGYYLKVTDAPHPGKKEVMDSMELDFNKIVRQICQSDYGKPVVFFKNMAHHLVEVELSFLDQLQNLFLIRDPREVLPSLINQIPQPTMRDVGLKKQWELFSHLSEQGYPPVIIDSKELLLDPESILMQVCDLTGLPYFLEMTNWKTGPLPEDGVWAKHWYQNVHESGGFQAYKPKQEPLPESLLDLFEECDHYYQLLYQQALKTTGP